MKKGRDVKNLPVISVQNGSLIGYIRDLKVSERQKVEGLYLETPAEGMCFLPLINVISIGPDAVLADGEPAGVSLQQYSSDEGNSASRVRVMTDSGRNLGTVEDVVIEEEDGSIVGYEISDGYLKDLLVGRKMISAAEILTYGNDVLIVAESAPRQGEKI